MQNVSKDKEILQREEPGITILAGMEVFATEELPRLLTEGQIFPVNRTRYVLMEFDFGEDPGFADRILRKVKEVRAIPMIAHVERYAFVQDDPAIVYRWKRRGYEYRSIRAASLENSAGAPRRRRLTF